MILRNSEASCSFSAAAASDQIERFERYVTDWEHREYAYHL